MLSPLPNPPVSFFPSYQSKCKFIFFLSNQQTSIPKKKQSVEQNKRQNTPNYNKNIECRKVEFILC